MLLNQCYPGRRVSYRRWSRPRHTFTGRILSVTFRGNVTVRLTERHGKAIAPIVLCVRPARLDDASEATQVVAQTVLL